MQSVIYLLHIEPRFKHAGHYLGYTHDLDKRIKLHLSGKGSPLVQAAVAAGCVVTLVRTFEGDGNTEQELNRVWGASTRLCPVCTPNAMRNASAYKSKQVR